MTNAGRARSKDTKASANDRLRVAVVLHGYEIDGIRAFLLNHLAHGDEWGIEWEYVCLGPGPFAEELRKAGARVTVIGVPMPFDRVNRGNPFVWLLGRGRFASAIGRIRRHLLRRRPNVVYTHADYNHVIAGLAAAGLGCCVIGQFHRMVNRKRFFGLQRICASLVYAAVLDGIFTISRTARDSLWAEARRRSSMLYNGIDVAGIRGRTRRARKQVGHVAIVGRISPPKQQDLAIRAIGLLAAEGVDCRLWVIGGPATESNAYYVHLRKLVADLGLLERVVFTGAVPRPEERVACCEVFVNCSTREAFGLVVAEAMACGTAVVAARGGGPGEIVADGHNGLCFEPGDAASLAAAVKKLLLDRDLRSRLTNAASRDAMLKFDLSVHMKAFRAEVRQLVERTRRHWPAAAGRSEFCGSSRETEGNPWE